MLPEADTEEDTDEGALDANDGRSNGVEVSAERTSLRQHSRSPDRSGSDSPKAETDEGKKRNGAIDVATGHRILLVAK